MASEDDRQEEEGFGAVRPDRRAFVKGLVGTTAFAVPFIASYDLNSLGTGIARAASEGGIGQPSNGTGPTLPSNNTGPTLPSNNTGPTLSSNNTGSSTP